MRDLRIGVPEDLLVLWSQTGGGDCFESGTLFRPTTVPTEVSYFVEGDDFDTANVFLRKDGMSPEYLSFDDAI